MRISMFLVSSIAVSVAIAALGCGGPQQGSGDDPPPPDNGGNPPDNGGKPPAPGTREDPIVLTASCPGDVPGDAYQLTSAKLDGEDGQLMEINVQYGGGCRTHRFVACWPENRFAESYPVQTWIALYHDADGDNCKALIRDTRYVDVSAIHAAYQQAYGSSGPIVMHIRDTDVSVTYQPPDAPAAPTL
jgi:hypothetical protein